MKSKAAVFLFVGMCVCGGAYAERGVAIAPRGETSIARKSGNVNVEVRVRTHQIEIGKASDGIPSRIDSSCTYSRRPCSVIDGLEIIIDGASLQVPRSVFCDLGDANQAILGSAQGGFSLTIYGGGQSEGYVVRLEFSKTEITKRILASSLLPDQPLQVTTYHRVVIGD